MSSSHPAPCLVPCLALATALATAVGCPTEAHARGSGYGDDNEAAYIGAMLGTSKSITLRMSGYGAGDADDHGYVRWDVQPWRLLMERPTLSPGVQYNNFGMHGGFMPLDWGPLAFGAGFGFDFLTVGLDDLDDKHPAGSYLLVPFGLEVAAALQMWSFSRLLLTYQLQIAGGGEFDNTLKRQGFTGEWYFAFGGSNIYMLLALEYGAFTGDGHTFGGGQALVGLTYYPFQ